MKLLEKLIYSGLTFVFVYALLFLTLYLFDLVSKYNAHLIAGFAAVVGSISLFLVLLIRKK